MDGVNVELVNAGPDGKIGGDDDTVVATGTTAADGTFVFTNVPLGTHYAKFTAPLGYGYTKAHAGNQTKVGSDVSRDGSTPVFEVYNEGKSVRFAGGGAKPAVRTAAGQGLPNSISGPVISAGLVPQAVIAGFPIVEYSPFIAAGLLPLLFDDDDDDNDLVSPFVP